MGIDSNEQAVATHQAAGFATVKEDTRDLDPLDFPCEGLIDSPPCQTFSMAGKGEGRKVLADIITAVYELGKSSSSQPSTYESLPDGASLVLEPIVWAMRRREARDPFRWIALEQVPAVLPIWEAYADVLRDCGYSVETGLVNAEQYGVPQTRKRAVLVAKLDGPVQLPAPTHSKYYPRTPEKLDHYVLP